MSSTYYNQTTEPQAPKKGKSWAWILGGCGVVAVIGALVCCGGFFLFGRFALDAAGQIVATQVQNDPAVQEHIGDITSCKLNIQRSTEVGNGGQVYSVEGSKGKGEIIVSGTRGDRLESATLLLPDGSSHALSLGAGDAADSMPDTTPDGAEDAPVGPPDNALTAPPESK